MSLAAAGLRASTLRKRVRTWIQVRAWLGDVHGAVFPASIDMFLDYLKTRADEPCAKSVLQSAMAALAFMESAGRVPGHKALATQKALRNGLAELELGLAATTGSAPARQAPRFPTQIIVALEEAVMCEAKPAYLRAYAWWTLVSVWAALRFDDHRGLVPVEVHRRLNGMEFSLLRTKTTGAGKKFARRPGFVSANAFLKQSEWLFTGLDVWESFGFEDRDYWLMCPSRDLEAARAIEMKYVQASAASRALLLTLGNEADGVGIVSPEAVPFWTLHSPRAWLPSAAASIGFTADWIDAIAAWRPKGGEVYVRTTRRRIRTIQEKVADRIRQAEGLEDILDEEEIFEQLATYLEKKGVEQHDYKLMFFQRQTRGHQETARSSEDELMWAELMGEEDGESRPLERVPQKAADSTVVKGEPGDYVVSVTEKRGFRRLHQLGRCYRVPGLHYMQWLTLGTARPTSAEYDDFCRNCWPSGVQKEGTSSEESSSGSSSSASE